ncbi:MAG: GNAT family N-acetyltransferase [Devosia indica]
MTAGLNIRDLREVPQYFDEVADRIWRAWWEPDGRTLAEVEAALRDVIARPGFPFSLVATYEDQFAGTITSISSDIAARPALGPCLAALWVEPGVRGQGVAGQLLETAQQRLIEQGFERVYLTAKPRLRGYYQPRGWTRIEGDIDADHLDVYVRTLR